MEWKKSYLNNVSEKTFKEITKIHMNNKLIKNDIAISTKISQKISMKIISLTKLTTLIPSKPKRQKWGKKLSVFKAKLSNFVLRIKHL